MDTRVDGRWAALTVLCLGLLLVAVDTTIVNVALSAISIGLGFSGLSIVWVVNAYLAAFGGCLLLGGRLGDRFGHRPIYLIGVSVFTTASVACGLATTPEVLVAGRIVQGIAAAFISAVALSLVSRLFTDLSERTKALGLCSFLAACGGSIGLVFGGMLTSALGWRWVFLVNLPWGLLILILGRRVLPRERVGCAGDLDWPGAALVTTSLLAGITAITNGGRWGWLSAEFLGLIASAIVLATAFLAMEKRARVPLISGALMRIAGFRVANIGSAMLASSLYTWFFIVTLYLQLVLQLNPMQVALTFLPANLLTGLLSLVVVPALVKRFGIRTPFVAGMLLVGVGLALLSRASTNSHVLWDVLPGTLLLGVGAGMAYNPLLLGALGDVPQAEVGAASGVINTSWMLGGTLGLTLLVGFVEARTSALVQAGEDWSRAFQGGYQAACGIGSLVAFLAIVTCARALQLTRPAQSAPYGSTG